MKIKENSHYLKKKADVQPFLKETSLDPSLPQNYRPISKLHYMATVLEKVYGYMCLTNFSLVVVVCTLLKQLFLESLMTC